MRERIDPTAYVDGFRVIQPPSPPKPLTFDEYHARKSSGMAFNIFALIVAVLVAVACVSILTGGEPKTFLSFLSMLQDVPSVSTEWLTLVEDLVIDLPSWLDWLEPFANILADLFKILSFFVVGIIQALTFILHILTWAFAV